ncbi:MAG: hypothetical protein ACPG1C_07860 [Alphaproteobacteria bacterium]
MVEQMARNMMAFDPFAAVQYGTQPAQEGEPNAPIHDTVIWTAKDGFSFDTDDATPAPDRNLVNFDKLVSAGQHSKAPAQSDEAAAHLGLSESQQDQTEESADDPWPDLPKSAARPGEKETFLGRPEDSFKRTKNSDAKLGWKRVEDAVRAAAAEIRALAKEYYDDYDEMRRLNLMLPEAGVQIYEMPSGNYSYKGILIGWVESGDDPFDHEDARGQVRYTLHEEPIETLAARLHFHWTDLEPSEGDGDFADTTVVGVAHLGKRVTRLGWRHMMAS